MKTIFTLPLGDLIERNKTQERFIPIVIDVDGAITEQTEFMQLFKPVTLSLSYLQPALRYYADFETLDKVRQHFLTEAGNIEGKIVFYGSGDFHNLAYVWLSLIREPVTLIHFDNHTDLYKNFSGVHAGNWAIHASKLPNVRKLIQLGVDGDLDINASSFLTNTPLPIGPFMNDLKMLSIGKLEVYPTAMQHSTMFGHLYANSPCVELTRHLCTTTAKWKNIRQFGIEHVVESVLHMIPTDAVYITIDKDVLREEDSFTNYYTTTQGDLRLEELLTAIEVIKVRKRIVAVDVCGDISTPKLRSNSKKLFAKIKDRKIPKEAFTTPEHIYVNQKANISLINCLNSTL